MYLTDANQRSPRLVLGMHIACLVQLPPDSIWPGGWGAEAWAHLQAHGVEIMQGGLGLEPAQIPQIGNGRILVPGDALRLALEQQDRGLRATTVHLGTGIEDDETIDRLAGELLDAVAQTGHPLWVETHRATATQDIWRTVQLVRRFPELRFNADLSHWYTGQELPYGDWDAKMAFITPVLERTAMLHGRIGNPGCIQVDIGDGTGSTPQVLNPELDFIAHFRDLWTRCARGFLEHAPPGALLPFLPELILPRAYYARTFTCPDGELQEECDRYQQALVLHGIMRECFAEAQEATESLSD